MEAEKTITIEPEVVTDLQLVEQVKSIQNVDEWSSSNDLIQLVKRTCAKNCSMDEFKLLFATAKLYNLNPLKKEVWAVKYGTAPANIMVGRDGFLSIAHKSGQFDGMNTTFEEKDGKIISATCTVYRKDMKQPIVATVFFEEYGTNASNPLWRTKPRTMLGKVAESHALRRAFNVSGVYSPEEMDYKKEEGTEND